MASGWPVSCPVSMAFASASLQLPPLLHTLQIEYHLVEFRPETKEVRVSLTAPEVVAELEKQDKELPL